MYLSRGYPVLEEIPVGGVFAWLKNFSGVPALPDNYMELDGSVVADAASPLNGQTLPNLQGSNQWIRGNSTSGGTGGSSTHSHAYSGSNTQSGANKFANGSLQGFASHSGTTVVASSEPAHYFVVWVIRIK
jgi:hypothetical protein